MMAICQERIDHLTASIVSIRHEKGRNLSRLDDFPK